VFVSAFLAGLLFQRRTEKQGVFRRTRAATVSRAVSDFIGPILSRWFFAFVVGGVFSSRNFPEIQHLLDQYFKNPGAAIFGRRSLGFSTTADGHFADVCLLSLC